MDGSILPDGTDDQLPVAAGFGAVAVKEGGERRVAVIAAGAGLLVVIMFAVMLGVILNDGRSGDGDRRVAN